MHNNTENGMLRSGVDVPTGMKETLTRLVCGMAFGIKGTWCGMGKVVARTKETGRNVELNLKENLRHLC